MKKLIVFILLCIFSLNSAAFCAAPQAPITDEFAERTLKYYKNTPIPSSVRVTITDEFVQNTLNPKDYKIIEKKKIVISETPEISVFLTSNDLVTTQNNITEGKTLEFTVSRDVVSDGKIIIPKGTKATGRVELITMNGACGTPADLTVGNFVLQDGRELIGQIKKNGANRSIWVYPTAYAGTFFFGAGILLLAVRGGHAKIKPAKEFELAY